MDHGSGRRPTSERVRSHSSERHSVRSPRRQNPETASQYTDHGHDVARVTSRDYAQTLSPSPTRSRPRHLGFGIPTASNLRLRLGSAAVSPNPSNLASSWRGFLDPRKKSIAVGVPSVQMTDAPSRKFSLAGPAQVETLMANQNYVDPGYAQLNPEYDQPANIRPVWGLAKPLPRVLRSAMVPAKDEIQKELQRETRLEDEHPDEALDLEAGRIEPTLRPDRITSQLDMLRRERELSLYRAYQQMEGSEAPSPFGRPRKPSEVPTEVPDTHSRYGHEETIQEETESDQYSRHEPPDMELPQLSEAIAGVKQAREEEEMKMPYQDAIPLPAYDAEDDEVHNLHTYWSVVRLYFRDPLSELLCVMVQDTIGFAVNLAMTVSHGSIGVNDTADYGWGFACMIAIYVGGGVSGAHINPAMSIMMTIYRGFPVRKLPSYLAAQFLGAFLSALLTYALFKPGLDALLEDQYRRTNSQTVVKAANYSPAPAELDVLKSFLIYPRFHWVTTGVAFCTELTATVLLTIAVLALGDDANAPPGAGMNAFIIGLLVVVLSMGFAQQTGLAMNPARDFGPRVAMYVLGYGRDEGRSLWADGYWFKVNWCAPICGTLLGAFLYDVAIFTGGESPVNYPTKRIKRVTRKWKKKWKARIARTKKKVKTMGSEPGYEPIER